MFTNNRIEAVVYLNRIRDNIMALRKELPEDTKACLVVKADAYGHGDVRVASAAQDLVDFYAVSCAYEARTLLDAGIRKPILCLGHLWPEDWEDMIFEKVRFNIFREEDARNLSDLAVRLHQKVYVHFSIETGMNRLGFAATAENAALLKELSALPGIVAEGLFSHFAKADESDLTDAYRQYDRFVVFRKMLEDNGLHIPICHISNSAASLVMRDASLNMVRLGIAAYGEYPSEEVEKTVPLRPAMEIKSHVSFLKTVPAGEHIGYGYTYTTPKPCLLATVPVGYADGYCRSLSNNADVLIHGKRARVRGRVCMDQMMVEIPEGIDVKEGDTVTLLGTDGEEVITLYELQDRSGVLGYEILCGFTHRRVPHRYISKEY